MRAVRVGPVGGRLAPILLVLCASCGIPVDSTAQELPSLGTVVIATTTTVSTAQTQTTERPNRGALVYFIRGEGLVGRALVVDSRPTAADLMRLLVEGLTGDDAAEGLRSGLEQRSDLVEGAEETGSVVVVDLATSLTDLPGPEQVLIVGQITLTLVANLRVAGVLFRQAGQPVAVPGADGQPVVGTVDRTNYVVLLTRT